MPPPPTLRVAEIFGSIQGEGLRQGEATIFIRLAGCNLRCAFCDTKRAWRGGRAMSAARILAAVRRLGRRWPASWADLTGGEPMLQDIGPLVDGLRADGLSIQIETNGTVFRPLPFDWITVSPKPPAYAADPRLRLLASEVKVVVSRELTSAAVERLRAGYPERVPLILQPQSNAAWSREKARRLLGAALRAGAANIRLGFQLHRLLRCR